MLQEDAFMPIISRQSICFETGQPYSVGSVMLFIPETAAASLTVDTRVLNICQYP